MALNNVGFLTPGGERWTLLRNALHFLSKVERNVLDPEMRVAGKPADRDRAPGCQAI